MLNKIWKWATTSRKLSSDLHGDWGPPKLKGNQRGRETRQGWDEFMCIANNSLETTNSSSSYWFCSSSTLGVRNRSERRCSIIIHISWMCSQSAIRLRISWPVWGGAQQLNDLIHLQADSFECFRNFRGNLLLSRAPADDGRSIDKYHRSLDQLIAHLMIHETPISNCPTPRLILDFFIFFFSSTPPGRESCAEITGVCEWLWRNHSRIAGWSPGVVPAPATVVHVAAELHSQRQY